MLIYTNSCLSTGKNSTRSLNGNLILQCKNHYNPVTSTQGPAGHPWRQDRSISARSEKSALRADRATLTGLSPPHAGRKRETPALPSLPGAFSETACTHRRCSIKTTSPPVLSYPSPLLFSSSPFSSYPRPRWTPLCPKAARRTLPLQITVSVPLPFVWSQTLAHSYSIPRSAI